MEIIKTFKENGNDVYGGYYHVYTIKFSHEPISVAEALVEIDKWRDNNGMPRGGFGYAYGTYVDGDIVESTWSEPDWKGYYTGNGKEKIIKARGIGGLYCGIDINLYTKEEKGERENENT